MKITKLIQSLQEQLKIHGDIECVVEDGLDPSDAVPVKELVYISDYSEYGGDIHHQPAISIE